MTSKVIDLTFKEPEKKKGCVNCKGKITNKNYKCLGCSANFCLKCGKLSYCKTCKGNITRDNKQEKEREYWLMEY